MAEKLQALLNAYTNQQAENIALENDIAQASVSVEIKGRILKKKRDEVSQLKKELHEIRMHHTQMMETQKSFEAAISTEKREKNSTYLEMVSTEHAVKSLQDHGKKIMVEHVHELNDIANEYIASKTKFRGILHETAKLQGEILEERTEQEELATKHQGGISRNQMDSVTLSNQIVTESDFSNPSNDFSKFDMFRQRLETIPSMITGDPKTALVQQQHHAEVQYLPGSLEISNRNKRGHASDNEEV